MAVFWETSIRWDFCAYLGAKQLNPEKMLELYNSGLSFRKIALLYAISHEMVRQQLMRIPGFLPRRRGADLIKIDVQKALDLYNSGLTFKEVAQMVGGSGPLIARRLSAIPGFVPHKEGRSPQSRKTPEVTKRS